MAGKTKNGAEKKETPLYVKIFIALFAGIAFGYVLNFMGGVENEIINDMSFRSSSSLEICLSS